MPLVLPYASEMWSERQYQRGSSAQRAWTVIGPPGFTEDDAISAAGVSEFVTHPIDARLMVQKGGIGVAPKGPFMKIVRAQYLVSADSYTPNPLDEPAEVLPQYTTGAEPFVKDIYGNAVGNSAGEPFASDPPIITNQLSFTVAQWESTYDAAKILAYTTPHPAINSDVVTIPELGGTFQPGQLMLTKVVCETPIRRDTLFVRNVYCVDAMAYRELSGNQLVTGFAHRLKDQGLHGYYNDGSNLLVDQIVFKSRDENGAVVPVGTEVLLDGHGTVFDPAQYRVYTPESSLASVDKMPDVKRDVTDEGVFLHFLGYKPMPFAALGWRLS